MPPQNPNNQNPFMGPQNPNNQQMKPQPQNQAGGPFVPQYPFGQSVEQQGLGGGGNPQQIQNFLTALQQVGAGRNNNQMNYMPMPQQQIQPMMGNIPQSNFNAGNMSFMQQQFPQNNPIPSIQFPQYQAPTMPNPLAQQQAAANSLATALLSMQAPIASGNPGNAGSTTGSISPLAVQNFNNQLFSDENVKTNIKEDNYQVQSFLDAIKAHSYEYKDPEHGKGRFVSPMAQELEKTQVGKSAVIDTPEGKMVDYGRLSGVILAAQAMLNERLNKIEKSFKVKK